jgi:2-haloacid dehalogenase
MPEAAAPAAVAGAVKALCFDIFGTVVDWRSSIIGEGQQLGQDLGLTVDWAAFADAWRAGYQPAMQQVRSGELPWTDIDGLHRRILNGLLAERGLALAEAEAAHFNRVWHRLRPWPDSVAGLLRLKAGYTISTLSNGNMALLVNMAKHAGLPEVYLGAARLLGLAPAEVMMVAAHPSDLRAAAACGLRTAYVARPLERGPGGPMEAWAEGEFDLACSSFNELATALRVR